MNLYPAIDLMDGKAVRLRQGKRDDVTVYGDPLEMAKQWRDLGAKWLHVVDLDAAFDGSTKALALLEKLVSGKWDEQFIVARPGHLIRHGDFF
jgi:phosphoribosylformimino-5-aminoimidazole carboxamide ribotide isomerase